MQRIIRRWIVLRTTLKFVGCACGKRERKVRGGDAEGQRGRQAENVDWIFWQRFRRRGGWGRGGEGRGQRAEGSEWKANVLRTPLRTGAQTKDTEPGGARDLTRQVNQPGLIIHNLLCTTECNTAHHHHRYVHKFLMKTTTLPWCTGAEVDIKSMPLRTRYMTRGPNSVLVLPNFFVGMFQC